MRVRRKRFRRSVGRESTADEGFIAIGYYANGSRNFYLKEDVAVTDPSVLASLPTIRFVQQSAPSGLTAISTEKNICLYMIF